MTRSPLALLSFLSGLLALLVVLGFRLVLSALYWGGSFTVFSLVQFAPVVHAAQFALAGLLAAAAIAGGSVGLVRRLGYPALAGAAIALGGAALAELLVGLLLGPYPLFN